MRTTCVSRTSSTNSRAITPALRCAADVADLRVSGIYQLTDTDATLALLQRTYPIRLRSIPRYWTLVEAIDSARI
ncbi:hypothetical protein [Paraburkholderia atlantica]|uniref:hypothetical protein n=1 Tax=Paraburkholderia atlantica TaxID=2654982 RepID=UPI0004777A63|nr:hypothetical protein [Paraburkholderia atlantica]